MNVDYSFLRWKDAKLAPYRDALLQAERSCFRASRNVDALIRTDANWTVRAIAGTADAAADLERTTLCVKRQAKKALEQAEAFYTLDEYYKERRRAWTA